MIGGQVVVTECRPNDRQPILCSRLCRPNDRRPSWCSQVSYKWSAAKLLFESVVPMIGVQVQVPEGRTNDRRSSSCSRVSSQWSATIKNATINNDNSETEIIIAVTINSLRSMKRHLWIKKQDYSFQVYWSVCEVWSVWGSGKVTTMKTIVRETC